jgi:hypothetical protein
VGWAAAGSPRLDVSHFVSNVSNAQVAFEGGAPLIISGSGFSSDTMANEVFVFVEEMGQARGRLACPITVSNTTHITCTAPTLNAPEYLLNFWKGNVELPIVVRTNQMEAACSKCSIRYNSSLSSQCESATMSGDGVVHIIGNKLSHTIVRIGEHPCRILSANTSNVECQLESVLQGEYEITLTSEYGRFVCSDESALLLVQPHVANIRIARNVSAAGGAEAVFRGFGFPGTLDDVLVSVDGKLQPVDYLYLSPSEVRLQLPGGNIDNIAQISLTLKSFLGDGYHQEATKAFRYVSSQIRLVGARCEFEYSLHVCSVTISGEDSVTNGSILLVGGVECVQNRSQSQIFLCDSLPVGRHRVRLLLSLEFGFAREDSQLHISTEFNASVVGLIASPIETSAAGGLSIVILGSGAVPSPRCEAAHYSLCGVRMHYVHTGSNTVELLTPKLPLIGSTLVQNSAVELLAGRIYSTGVSSYFEQRAFDSDPSTHVLSNAKELCALGKQAKPGFLFLLHRVRWYAQWNFASVQRGARIEARLSPQSAWQLLAVISEIPREGWNYLDIPQSFRSTGWETIRFAAAEFSGCRLNEVEFIGKDVLWEKNESESCSLTATFCDGEAEVLRTVAVVTSGGLLSSIEPRFGSALGGTRVSLLGEFPATQALKAVVSVELNGAVCRVEFANASLIRCISAPKVWGAPASVHVHIGGYGNIVVAELAKFAYLDRWSDPQSWQFQQIPAEGDTVVIPPEQAILFYQYCLSTAEQPL